MRRWLIRCWFVLTAVMVLMLIPGVALADNCSDGGLLDCWDSAGAAAAAAAAAAAVAAGGFFSGSGSSTQQGPNDPRGGVSDPLRDLLNDLNTAPSPPPGPGVMETIYDEIKDFVRAQTEGFSDFVEGVKDVGEEVRHDIAKEIAEDFKEDPTNRYGD